MIKDKGIIIRNIYYMLAYAFQELGLNSYRKCESENFENAHDLFAEILVCGLSTQLKQGLHRRYTDCRDTLTTLRGKLDISATASCLAKGRQVLVCEFDVFSENNIFNRILKTTIALLTQHPGVDARRKSELRKLQPFFAGVDGISMDCIRWNSLRFDRNTRRYRMLMYICYFIIDNIIFSNEHGRYDTYSFSDTHMCRLFERFVLEYYRRHHPELRPRARQISWNIIEAESTVNILPIMQTDIFLSCNNGRTLIIDTKYYGSSMATHYNKAKIHSSNQYQIFTYMMNHDREHTGCTDGMLLYARTQDEIQPDGQIKLSDGNVLYYRNLDLSVTFDEIRRQLEGFIAPYSA